MYRVDAKVSCTFSENAPKKNPSNNRKVVTQLSYIFKQGLTDENPAPLSCKVTTKTGSHSEISQATLGLQFLKNLHLPRSLPQAGNGVQNQVHLETQIFSTPKNSIQAIPDEFRTGEHHLDIHIVGSCLVKMNLNQLTFSFLKNPSLNLLVVNPLTPAERSRWYLA